MRRLTPKDDRGAVTVFVVLMMPLLLLASVLVFDGGRGILARRQTQNAADAGALAKATDCAKGISITSFTPYETNGAVLYDDPSDPEPDCLDNDTTVWMKRTISPSFNLGLSDQDVKRSATAKWGTVSSADTIPIAIASCEFTPAILNGTDNIYLYLDHPSPLSGCSGGPGGFGSLTDNGSDSDCLTASVVNNVAVGGTGASDHAAQCITDRFGTILNGGGFVDVFVPIYGAYSHVGSDYNYTIVGYATFRLRGYEFNGAPGDAGTLDGGGPSHNCPDIGPGNEYCLHGDFVKFTTSQGTPGPSTDFGTYRVYLSS